MIVLAVLVAAPVALLLVSAWAILFRIRRDSEYGHAAQLTTAGLSATSGMAIFAIAGLALGKGTQAEIAASMIVLASAMLLTVLIFIFLVSAQRSTSGKRHG